jgi:hypothetical protein
MERTVIFREPSNVYGWGRADIFAAVGGATPTPTPHCNCDADRHGDSHRNAIADVYTAAWANGEAASHSSAETINFSLRKIFSIRGSTHRRAEDCPPYQFGPRSRFCG